jgi:hypothetical protein
VDEAHRRVFYIMLFVRRMSTSTIDYSSSYSHRSKLSIDLHFRQYIVANAITRIIRCRAMTRLCHSLSRCSRLHPRLSPLIQRLHCIPPIIQAPAISKLPTIFLHISPSPRHIPLLRRKALILLAHRPQNMYIRPPPT